MKPLSDFLTEQIEELGLSADEFSQLLIRLLDYGVINRDESLIEATLYDRYLLCANLVEDYLSILHLKIVHDRQFRFVRVFPPNAVIPGVADDDHEQDSPFQNGFRTKPSTGVINLMLGLRVEYEKALREGNINETGSVFIDMEALVITLKNSLKFTLPEAMGERNAMFRQLRQLRLIKYNNDTLTSNDVQQDGWIQIEPSITSFVNQDVLDQLYPSLNELSSSGTQPLT